MFNVLFLFLFCFITSHSMCGSDSPYNSNNGTGATFPTYYTQYSGSYLNLNNQQGILEDQNRIYNIERRLSLVENQLNSEKPTTFGQFCGQFYDHMKNNGFKQTKKLFRRILIIAVPLLVSLGLYKLDISGRQGEIKLLKLQLSNGKIDQIGYQAKYNQIVRLSVSDFLLGAYGLIGIICYSSIVESYLLW